MKTLIIRVELEDTENLAYYMDTYFDAMTTWMEKNKFDQAVLGQGEYQRAKNLFEKATFTRATDLGAAVPYHEGDNNWYVRAYDKNLEHKPEADYWTAGKEDAVNTAKAMMEAKII